MHRLVCFHDSYFRNRLNEKIIILVVILAILGIGLSANFAASTLNNITDLNAAFSDAKSQNKNIVIIFDQDNCAYCDMLKKNVLSDAKVIDELNIKSIVVIVNINDHPEWAGKYNAYGTPITVILDSNQNEIGRINGYVEADEFLKIIQGI